MTGSRNAGLAQCLAGSRADVVRRQPGTALKRAGRVGTVLGRAGRVHLNLEDNQVSVGGDTHTIVRGIVAL